MSQTKLKESQVAAATNNQTGTDYTLGLIDSNRTVRMTNAAPNTVTVPANASVAIRIGSIITVLQWGAGQTTLFEDSGVTINTFNGLILTGQGAAVDLIKVGVDEWDLVMYAAEGAAAADWEVSNLSEFSYASDMVALTGVGSERGVAFDPVTGGAFFVGDASADDTSKFSGALPWSLADAVNVGQTSVIGSDVESVLSDIFIEPSGQYAFACGGNNKIFRFTLSTPGDALTAVYDGASFDYDYSALTAGASAFFVSADGSTILLQDGTAAWQISLSVPFDPSSGSVVGGPAYLLLGTGISANPSGSQIFALKSDKTVKKYNTTDFSVASATDSGQTLDLGSVITTSSLEGFYIKPDDGAKIYVVRQFPSEVYAFERSV